MNDPPPPPQSSRAVIIQVNREGKFKKKRRLPIMHRHHTSKQRGQVFKKKTQEKMLRSPGSICRQFVREPVCVSLRHGKVSGFLVCKHRGAGTEMGCVRNHGVISFGGFWGADVCSLCFSSSNMYKVRRWRCLVLEPTSPYNEITVWMPIYWKHKFQQWRLNLYRIISKHVLHSY